MRNSSMIMILSHNIQVQFLTILSRSMDLVFVKCCCIDYSSFLVFICQRLVTSQLEFFMVIVGMWVVF